MTMQQIHDLVKASNLDASYEQVGLLYSKGFDIDFISRKMKLPQERILVMKDKLHSLGLPFNLSNSSSFDKVKKSLRKKTVSHIEESKSKKPIQMVSIKDIEESIERINLALQEHGLELAQIRDLVSRRAVLLAKKENLLDSHTQKKMEPVPVPKELFYKA